MELQLDLPTPPDPDPYRDPLSRAVVSEVHERGAEASVSGVLERSGVGVEVFRERYATIEDCAVDSFERFIAAYERSVGIEFNAHPRWRDSVRAAAYETADFIEEDEELVHFGMTGVLQMRSELARVRREEVFIFCGGLIDLGRSEPSSLEVDDAAAMFAIGSIIQLLTLRMQTGGAIEPHAMVPEMMYSVVRVYRGEEEAREELEIGRGDA